MNNKSKRLHSEKHPLLWALITIALFLGIWLFEAIGTAVCPCWPLKHWATSLGVGGFTLFSLSLILSTRWKKLEDWFGGLDRIYQTHRILGILGFCLILLHPWIEGLKWLPDQPEKFMYFTLPVHGRLSMNLGSMGYWLMVWILGITLLKLLPYNRWKTLHKFMSLVFLFASLHIVLSEKRVGSEFAQSMLYLPMGIGFLAIFYKQLYLPFFDKRLELVVTDVNYINENVVEVMLKPAKTPLEYSPGQYGFFSFNGPSLTKESHPFTMIRSNHGSTTSLLIKARGDYTQNFYKHIQKGNEATFEGPYGRLNYTQAGHLQLWVAGGIGVALFLAWLRDERYPKTIQIDFYYCIHRREDAIFYHEFKEFSEIHPGFRTFLHCSEEGNRLDINKILKTSGRLNNHQIFMCGPLKLTNHFRTQFEAQGVPKDNIYYENFEFF